jgi:predicted NBD/HSP70 family sugar kinase
VTDSLRIGLDIGATKVLGAVMDAGGTVIAQARQDTTPGPDGILASATTVLDLLATALANSHATRALPSHIGIGIPGIVDRDRGAVSHAVNLGLGGDWFPLADQLADRTGAKVVVENDLNAATWGAHVLSGADDLAYLSLGTGLAAGFVLSGTLRRGFHGVAGEIGHVPIDPDGAVCSCGQRGCLELSASGSALSAAWPSAAEVPPAVALFAAAAAGYRPRPLRRGGGGRGADARPGGRPGRDHHRRRRRARGRAAAGGGHRGAARPGRHLAVPRGPRPGRPDQAATGPAARRRDRRRPDRERWVREAE